MIQIMNIAEKTLAAGHAETAALLNLTPADVSLGMWSQAVRPSTRRPSARSRRGLPAIHDVRQALAPNGVT